MNDLEVTMRNALPKAKIGLNAHALAVEVGGAVLQLGSHVPAAMRFLTDQLYRAACSVPLNIAEGHGRFGRDRMYHWRIAYGSAKEASSALQMLAAGGLVDADGAARVLGMLDSVRAMLWRLMNPRR